MIVMVLTLMPPNKSVHEYQAAVKKQNKKKQPFHFGCNYFANSCYTSFFFYL